MHLIETVVLFVSILNSNRLLSTKMPLKTYLKYIILMLLH